MEKVTHNIESEKKLLSMLGFNLMGPDNSNRWLIIDENDSQIGFIQYKKLYDANAKNGYSKTYGYYTKINNKGICYESTRKIEKRNKEIDSS